MPSVPPRLERGGGCGRGAGAGVSQLRAPAVVTVGVEAVKVAAPPRAPAVSALINGRPCIFGHKSSKPCNSLNKRIKRILVKFRELLKPQPKIVSALVRIRDFCKFLELVQTGT